MNTTSKIPLFVIFLVIIFILVIVIILSSYGSSEKPIEKPVLKLKPKKEKKIVFGDSTVSTIPTKKESDSLCFEFSDLTHNISYLFGSEFDNSSISIYKEVNDEYIFLKSNVYSGNQGFVISSNPLNVNASYFQLGTKLDLENIRYNCIYLDENTKYKIIVNNTISTIYKVYRFRINYSIQKSFPPLQKTFSNSFGLSEYDLEYIIRKNYPNVKTRCSLHRLYLKQWEFNENGDFLLVYLRNKYNFIIKDTTNGNNWKSEEKKDKEYELQYEIIQSPNLLIENLDETINIKTFNSELVEFLNTPITLYDQFLHGKKMNKIDIRNRISNKILIFKI
jgi:hypothetical protein